MTDYKVNIIVNIFVTVESPGINTISIKMLKTTPNLNALTQSTCSETNHRDWQGSFVLCSHSAVSAPCVRRTTSLVHATQGRYGMWRPKGRAVQRRLSGARSGVRICQDFSGYYSSLCLIWIQAGWATQLILCTGQKGGMITIKRWEQTFLQRNLRICFHVSYTKVLGNFNR